MRPNDFIRDERGLGIEDSTFMLVLTVMILIVAVGVSVAALVNFVDDNEAQAAADAATTLYKRARLLSLTYDGTVDSFEVDIPYGYAVVAFGRGVYVYSYRDGAYRRMTEVMELDGVKIMSLPPILHAGKRKITMTYTTGYGTPYILIRRPWPWF